MRCKHEGGKGPCLKQIGGACKVWRAQYQRETRLPSSRERTGRGRGRVGIASELMVRADLLHRGFEVTKPDSPNAKHDIHVELPSVGWKGVQVKSGMVHARTNALASPVGRAVIDSPILALVYMPTKRVEYRAGTEPLPPELEEA